MLDAKIGSKSNLKLDFKIEKLSLVLKLKWFKPIWPFKQFIARFKSTFVRYYQIIWPNSYFFSGIKMEKCITVSEAEAQIKRNLMLRPFPQSISVSNRQKLGLVMTS